MRFVSLIILALGIGVLVAGCSKVYSPAGLSPQDSARDEYECQKEVHPRVYGPGVAQNDGSWVQYRKMYQTCLMARGWTKD